MLETRSYAITSIVYKGIKTGWMLPKHLLPHLIILFSEFKHLNCFDWKIVSKNKILLIMSSSTYSKMSTSICFTYA